MTTTDKALKADISHNLLRAVYDSYKIRHQEECILAAMAVPGATPELMREVADSVEAQSAQNQGVEWGDVRSRAMDAAWSSALREAARRMDTAQEEDLVREMEAAGAAMERARIELEEATAKWEMAGGALDKVRQLKIKEGK